MIRSIIFPRVLGKSRDELQPVLEFLRALGFAPGREWREGESCGMEMLAASGGIELIATPVEDEFDADLRIEVSDADTAWQIVKEFEPEIRHEIADIPDGGRHFEIEAAGLIIEFFSETTQRGESHGLEGRLDGAGKRFAIVVSRFNSFITERLLDGAMRAFRQCGTSSENVTIVHVPGAFEIPSAARQLAETRQYDAIVCLGCLIRGGTLHYEVIANEVTRGVGQSAQETGVPHAFGVLTCDTLEQAIDRAGLKAGNKGFEAGLAAVEMASLRERVKEKAGSSTPRRSAGDDGDRGPSTPLRSAQDDKVAKDGKR